VFVEKCGKYDKEVNFSHAGDIEAYNNHLSTKMKRLAVLEFSRDRKAMSVICQNPETERNTMFIKGAPDYILKPSERAMNG